MPRTKQEHWSHAALRERLSEEVQVIYPPKETVSGIARQILRTTITPDWHLGTVFLFDPNAKRDIEATFGYLYPEILRVFENERFLIPPFKEVELSENRDREASCNLCFVVRDSIRPGLGAESPWWYLRFKLHIREGAGYSLLTELHLSLPYWLEADWALDFMIISREWENSPILVAEHEEISLRFESTKRGWLSFADGTSELNDFLTAFRAHIQIAKAIDRFSAAPNNRFLKCNMLSLISEFYGAE